MFHDWENFYLIVGSGAAALIGVMFVVTTLAAGFDKASVLARGVRIYMTPVVFHFSVIVVVSAISVAPEVRADVVGATVGLSALIGLTYAVLTTIRMFKGGLPTAPDLSDKWFYGVLPSLVYVGLGAAAIACWTSPDAAADGIGATMLVLLLIGIRNAWDLATYMTMTVKQSDNPNG